MEQQEYTIKIIPGDGGQTKSIKLSSGLLKYGIASAIIGVVILIGAFGYAAYSAYYVHNQSSQIEELKQVNRIQQEQLLQLSKKANTLQDQLEEISQMELELRQISGVGASTVSDEDVSNSSTDESNDEDEVYDGQGGPMIEPNVEIVRAALDDLELKIAVRKMSLEQLKAAMKERVPIGTFIFSGMPGSTMPSIWPAVGDVSSPYGLRWGGSDFHPGMDIANDYGTPIVATADGTVEEAGWNTGGYGNLVDVDHGNGYKTRYAHCQQVVVSPGQYVHKGQVIAYMGSTGYSTGPHVHYEIFINGQRVNPVGYL